MADATRCEHCDQVIEPDDGGAIWYHRDSMEAFCDPEGEQDLARQAEPAVVSPANGARVVFYTNEGFFDPQEGLYALAQITQDEAGYAVYAWYDDLERAQDKAADLNALFGNSTDDVLTVVASSMRLGNRR
jgi:hypothetical protein